MIPATAYHYALALEKGAAHEADMTDRITIDDDGELDEAVFANASIHIERLNDGCIWISIEQGCDANIITLSTARNAKIGSTIVQETYMAKAPTKLKGIPVKGVNLKDGKITKTDSAPPHVRAGRSRKRNAVTGARAAK